MSVRQPTDRYLSPAKAKRFYDRIGSAQDWQGFFENPAINEMIGHAAFDSAQSVFEFGCGTGALAARLLQRHLPPDARYLGLDISSTMVSLAQERLQPWSERARVRQSEGYPRIPEADRSFDRFVSTYVFNLLAPDFIDQLFVRGSPPAYARRQALSGEHDVWCISHFAGGLLGLATTVATQSGRCGRVPSHRTFGVFASRFLEGRSPDQSDKLGRHF